MTVLSNGPTAPSASAVWRRLLVVSLRDLRPAATWALVLAGFPVLVAAWALMSPPTVLSKTMTQDLLFNLAGAWQVYLGQATHVDFHDPSGRLSFLLTALGFHLVGPSPFAFLVNVAIVTTLLFAASFLVAIRRLPLLPAVLFVLFTSLLALMPANVGDRPDHYTFAMSYNRYGWSAYCILALLLFVPPRPSRHGTSIDLAVAGGLLVLMFYFKITYFAAGLATIGFALLFHPHIGRRWPAWFALCTLLVANALAPWERPYLTDILQWSASGAVRTGIIVHINNFLAAIGLYSPHLAAIAIAGWMWLLGKASFRFPLTLALLLAVSFGLLTQNSQVVGLPPGIVILLILYDWLRRHHLRASNRDVVPLLLTLLIFPFIEVSYSAASIAGYHAVADSKRGLYVVDRTNLAGLAVPGGERGTFLSFSPTFDHPKAAGDEPTRPRYQLTDYEYVLVLLEAAELVERQPPGGVALFDSINPLPFMLGQNPPRGANLWSTWNAPLRPAPEYLADVRYVLVPKFSLNPNWTDDLMRLYGKYLDRHFTMAAETRCWILFTRDHDQPPGERQSAM
jgi:hypothetical protein